MNKCPFCISQIVDDPNRGLESEDDMVDIMDQFINTVSPFAVAALYHDMAKVLNIKCTSSQLSMSADDKDTVIAMARNDKNHVIQELESLCHYIQKKNMEDIAPVLY